MSNNQNDIYEFTMSDDTKKMRLDKALSSLMPDFSRSRLKKIIEDEGVLLNGERLTSLSKKVEAGDHLVLSVPAVKEVERLEADASIPLDIIYEDEDLLVINKQAGLVVHPGAGNKEGTLVHALLSHCADSLSGIGGEKRPGIVHRLDKDTSGLMLVAKNDKAHLSLSEQLSDRSLSREYACLVWGNLSDKEGQVDTQLGRSRTNRKKMAVLHDGGKQAVTDYKVAERFFNICDLVHCKLQTGRTHQIRVHMTHLGHPLLGDPTYGQGNRAARRKKDFFKNDVHYQTFMSALEAFDQQALHAYKIGFIHPSTGEAHQYTSEIPAAMQHLINLLRDNFMTA